MSNGGYQEELELEMKTTDPNSHASRLVAQEIARLKGDEEDTKKEQPRSSFLELHTEKPQKCSVKVRIPVKEHPRYNFVGKLLGPKGATLKELQQQTGCKMAIMGRGSMREKDKEEELRKEGGKYAHLNEDLHVLVECFSEPTEGYHRVAAALVEVRKFVIPELAGDEMYGGEMGMAGEGLATNGAAHAYGAPPPRGRGGFGRGGERGAVPRGRGGYRGRGAPGGHPPPAGRGAPPPAGPPARGAPRGAPRGRGAPVRGAHAAPPPAAAPAYDAGYGQDYSYGAGYDTSYDGYSQRGAEASYYDYGASSAASGYESYSADGYGYGETYAAKPAPPPVRGAAPRARARAHPYGRPPAASGY